MINLKHTSRLAKIYWAYSVNQKTRLTYPPYRLWIEPTSNCNLKCVMCPNKDLSQNQLGMMDFTIFKKIIDEAKHFIHDANIHHRGESLLHENLLDMIRYANASGLVLKLHTNATLLTEKRAVEIIESGLNLISFSFEGLNKKTYEKYRVGAKYERTIENIISFLQIKKQLRKNRPFTVLELLDFRDYDDTYDVSTIYDFKAKFEGLPLDRLIIKKPHNFAGNIQLNKVQNNKSYIPCTFLWHSLIILWNGDVCPCPQDFHGKIILGNVKHNSLRELFNANQIVALREKAINGDLQTFTPCSYCDIISRKRFFKVPFNSILYLGN